MEWLANAWNALVHSQPDWELILRFLTVLVWPFVALIALVSIRPGRIIDAILENGGEVSAGGASIKLSKRIDEVAASIRQDVETDEAHGDAEETPTTNPLGDAADAYTTIMNGWGLVVMALENALERTHLDPLDGRRPLEAVRRLRHANMIGNKLERNIENLWDLRNKVKNAGSNRMGRLGITRDDADAYYQSAAQVKRSVANAIAYRERMGMISVVPQSQIRLDLAATSAHSVN